MESCAFNAMMEQHEKLVYTVCLRLVHDEHLRGNHPGNVPLRLGAPQRLPGRRAEGLTVPHCGQQSERPFEKRLGPPHTAD